MSPGKQPLQTTAKGCQLATGIPATIISQYIYAVSGGERGRNVCSETGKGIHLTNLPSWVTGRLDDSMSG